MTELLSPHIVAFGWIKSLVRGVVDCFDFMVGATPCPRCGVEPLHTSWCKCHSVSIRGAAGHDDIIGRLDRWRLGSE